VTCGSRAHCGTLRVMYMYQYYICMLGH